MRQDWSWSRAAGKYLDLYGAALADRTPPSSGRARLGVSAPRRVFAGVDLGGTKILVLIADGDGRVLGQARVTDAGGGRPRSRYRPYRGYGACGRG